MSVFILKIIAVICMTCDHIRYIDPILDNEITKILGRVAFPIFAFLIVEGYNHTHDLKKYMKRLFLFALVSQIPFLCFIQGCNITEKFELNVMFTMLFGIISILIYDKEENIYLKFFGILGILGVSDLLKVDYGAIGVAIIFVLYVFEKKDALKYFLFLALMGHKLLGSIHYRVEYMNYALPYLSGEILAIMPMMLYNGKIGKYKMKYFFYMYYPLHMLLIFAIYKVVHM